MSFLGLAPADMAVLGAALGGAMVLLYVLKLRRRRVEVLELDPTELDADAIAERIVGACQESDGAASEGSPGS